MALLDHLGGPLELREAPVGEKPAGIELYSPSGHVPLLVHRRLALTESRVMLEHLAEHHEFAGAYPSDLAARTLHRQAMALVDEVLPALLFGRDVAGAHSPRLDRVLTGLERAAATTPPEPCLLAFHVAPLWLRFRWWHPAGAVTRAVEAREDLFAWLDASARLDSVARTAPDPLVLADDLKRARQAGLLPADWP